MVRARPMRRSEGTRWGGAIVDSEGRIPSHPTMDRSQKMTAKESPKLWPAQQSVIADSEVTLTRRILKKVGPPARSRARGPPNAAHSPAPPTPVILSKPRPLPSFSLGSAHLPSQVSLALAAAPPTFPSFLDPHPLPQAPPCHRLAADVLPPSWGSPSAEPNALFPVRAFHPPPALI